MKQILSALLALFVVYGSGGAPAAEAAYYRDHNGWHGTASRPVSHSAATPVMVRTAAALRAYTRRAAPRYMRARHTPTRYASTRYRRYYRPATPRTYRSYKQIWFGNRKVWWPVDRAVRPVARRAAYRPAARSWRAARRPVSYAGQRTWAPVSGYQMYYYNGRRVPATHSSRHVIVLPATSAARRWTPPSDTQVYYYDGRTPTGPTTAGKAPAAPVRSVPRDNIPTTYIYQQPHRAGIKLPPASVKAPEAPPAAKPAAPPVPAPPAPPAP